MKSATSLVNGLAQVESFLSIGKSATKGCSLKDAGLTALLDQLELAIKDDSILPAVTTLTDVGMKAALKHYHSVYALVSDLVPISIGRWRAWHDGLIGLLKTDNAIKSVEELRVSLMAEWHKAFQCSWWGSTLAVESALRNIDLGGLIGVSPFSLGVEEEAASQETPGNTREKQYGPFLQRFNRLCYDAQHMFALYASIGAMERSFFLEEVMKEGDEMDMEPIIRQTFKRDFSVPSAMLSEELLADYEEFEIDDKKKKTQLTARTQTLHSSWYAAAHKLFLHEGEVLRKELREGGVPTMVLDEKGCTIADELVQVLRKSSRSNELYAAFALTVQRYLEKEHFPAVMNPSRLEFSLVLLQRWLLSYTSRKHRWTIEDPFASGNDDSLWTFVVERHDTLLRWALHTAGQEHSSATTENSLIKKYDAYANDVFTAQLSAIRTVSYSLIHCWQRYVSMNSQSHSEKVSKCCEHVTSLIQEWVSSRLINHYARACLNDMYDALDEDDGADDTPHKEFLVLKLEATLKLFLCDVMSAVDVSQQSQSEIRTRLSPLLEDLIALGEASSQATVVEVLRTALRISSRLQKTREHLSSEMAHEESESVFVAALVDHYKKMLKLCAGCGDVHIVDTVEDQYMACITHHYSVSDTVCGAYVSRQGVLGVKGGLLMDLACDSRRVRKELNSRVDRKRPREEEN